MYQFRKKRFIVMAKLIQFIFVVIFITVSTANQINNHDNCRATCSREYKPICGQNKNKKLETFANDCLFNYRQCSDKNGEWQIISYGRCDQESRPKRSSPSKCNSACTFEYRPLCGKNSNGKLRTFGNKCEFEWIQCSQPNEGWTFLNDNECVQDDKIILLKRYTTSQTHDCPKICSTLYSPICAKDNSGNQETFANECQLRAKNCAGNNKYTVIKQGACSGKVKRATRPGRPCPNICPLNYAPVCGQDSRGNYKTFSNSCQLNAANCPRQTYRFVKDGKC